MHPRDGARSMPDVDVDAAVGRQSGLALEHALRSNGAGLRTRVLALAGGVRGLVDGAVPPLVFVMTHAAAGARLSEPDALRAGIGAAGMTAAALILVRVARRESLRQCAAGVLALAVSVAFAARSGDARGFFLPGIYVDTAYAVVFLGSVAVRRPLVGTIHRWLFSTDPARRDQRLQRTFSVATVGWSAVYSARAAVQAGFYRADEPTLLATAKVALGWPLTVAALAATLGLLRRADVSRRS